jgi:glycosyltransferase involved in cell wall biosynthesis
MSIQRNYSIPENKPVRVLYCDHTAALGGGEIALLNLVRHIDRSKVHPVILLSANGPLCERLNSVAEVHVLPLSPEVLKVNKDSLGLGFALQVLKVLRTAIYIWRVARWMRKMRIDLVHTNSLKSDIIGGFAGRLCGLPVIWHVRDRIEDDYLPRLAVRVFRVLARMVPVFVIANSSATLATLGFGSAAQGIAIPSDIELEQGEAVEDQQVRVVHDGLDVETCARAITHATGGPLIGLDSRIGLIGRLSRWKGQHIFLRAAAIVHREFPCARFQIIGAALFGQEAYEQEIRELCTELGLNSVVEFTGFRSDIHNAIANLEIVVHASITGEPFGQVIVEGMASGKPVIATNGGGVPEIVEDGVTGLLVPMNDAEKLADAIRRLLTDPHEAQQMGLRGLEHVRRHFTIQQTARKVERVYEKLCIGA